jgi:hypothetical protein
LRWGDGASVSYRESLTVSTAPGLAAHGGDHHDRRGDDQAGNQDVPSTSPPRSSAPSHFTRFARVAV